MMRREAIFIDKIICARCLGMMSAVYLGAGKAECQGGSEGVVVDILRGGDDVGGGDVVGREERCAM